MNPFRSIPKPCSTRANTTASYLMKCHTANRSSPWRRNPCHHTNAFLTGNVDFPSPAWRHYVLAALIRLVNFLHPHWASLRGSQRLVVTGILHTELLPFPAILSPCSFLQETHPALYPCICSSISFAVAFNKGVIVHPYLQV